MKLASVMFTPLFVYPILGVALLGYGAAGSILALRGAPDATRAPSMFGHAMVLFAAVMLPAFLVVNSIDVPANELLGTLGGLPLLLLTYSLLTAPFVLAGLAISAVFSAYAEDVNRLYFADMLGAGLGSVLVVAGLPWVGGTPLMAVGATVAAVAAAVALHDTGRSPRMAVLVGGANVVALVVLLWVHPIPVHIAPDKHGPLLAEGARPGGLALDFSEWSTLGRVDITEPFATLPPQMGGDLSPAFSDLRIEQRMLVLDGAAPAFFFNTTKGLDSLDFLAGTSQSAVYQLRAKPHVLVVGVGGGTDVLMALALGASQVTAVELNPVNAHAVREVFADYIGNVMADPRVELIVEEGRHFAASDTNHYDVIQLSGVDTGAALGAYGLGTMPESYVYTVEALGDFLERLNPDGILTITRDLRFGWGERLAAVARAALLARGLDPVPRMAVLEGKVYGWATVLVKREPFTAAEVETLRAFSAQYDFPFTYDPLVRGTGPFDAVIRDGLETHDNLDLRPSTDDWPFFFLSFRWDRISSVLRAQASPLLNPIGFLAASLGGLTLVAVILIGLPLWQLRGAWHGTTGRLVAVGYFAALGAGFMVAEVALMQRFTVFLGNPMLAVSTVLGVLLVASGTGSWLGRGGRISVGVAVTWIVAMLLVLASPWLRHSLQHLLGLGLVPRLAITVALVIAVGIPMGMPFPAGLARLAVVAPRLVPWGWGINAMVSVLTSLASYFIGMIAGYTAMFYTSAVLYLVALILARRL